ncbi:MAG: energy transducer TonB [Puniceicoccaceae bacterium]
MKTHQPCLTLAISLAILGLSQTGFSEAVSPEPSLPRSPELITDITALVPQSLANEDIDDPRVTCMVQINHLGNVEDIVSLKASHSGLITRAENLIREAEFYPGELAENESVRLEIVLGFIYPSQAGLSSKTTMDDVEIMIGMVKSEDHSVAFKNPPELDAMPKILETGQIYVAEDPDGNRIPGSAKIEFYINHLGEVRLPRIIESSHPEISKAAILSVQDMRFTPPLSDGRPVVTKLRMPFNSGA